MSSEKLKDRIELMKDESVFLTNLLRTLLTDIERKDIPELTPELDAPRTMFTIPEIASWACEHNPDQLDDPQDGIAAVTRKGG